MAEKIAENTPEENIQKSEQNEENLHEDIMQSNEGELSDELLENQLLDIQNKLIASEETAKDNLNKAIRAIAELENTRKRMDKEVNNARKYGIDKFVKELLPVVDCLEQAASVTEDDKELTKVESSEGITLTLKMLLDTFANFSIEQLDPIGQPFDPLLHEAMSTLEDETEKPGTVLTVYQKGYRVFDRIIRPARVVVSK